jgi:hypothetical protein
MMNRPVSFLPQGLPPDVRDDVAAAVIMAVCEGRFLRTFGAKEAKRIMTEHCREFSKFSTASLDDVLTPDGATRGTPALAEGV